MKIQSVLCIAGMLLTLQSCYRDKGNYDYADPNKVSISYPQGDVDRTVIMSEPYKVFPIFEFSHPKDSLKIESTWVFESDTIGRERNLNYTFNKAVTGGAIYHYVKDLTTGYVSMKKLTIDVKSKYSKGWCILSERSGNSVLSFILPKTATSSTPKSFVAYPDIYNTLHADDPLGAGPVKLIQSFSKAGSLLTVLQSSGKGSVVLDGNDYTKIMYSYQEFIENKYPAGFSPKDMNQKMTYDIFLSQNGKLYSRVSMDYENSYNFFTTQFIDLPVQYNGTPLNVDRLIAAHPGNAKMMIVYEASNKRFLCINAVSSSKSGVITITKKMPCSSSATQEELDAYNQFVDLNNLGDWELVYVGAYNIRYQSVNLMMVLKKGTNYQVQSCNGYMYNKTYLEISDLKIYTFDSSKISKDTKFFKIDNRPYLFFAEQGKLYWYDLTTQQTHLFYDCGATVADMEVNPARSELGVGLESGEFLIFNITDQALMNATIKFRQSGFDKIIDLEYKRNDITAWYSTSED